jgi:HD superfamily phosphodiesterase
MPLKDKITAKDAAAITLRLKSGADLAKELGTSPAYINAVLRRNDVKRIKGPVSASRAQAKADKDARIAHRTQVAKDLAENKVTMEEACRLTQATSRTMFRYLAEARREPT